MSFRSPEDSSTPASSSPSLVVPEVEAERGREVDADLVLHHREAVSDAERQVATLDGVDVLVVLIVGCSITSQEMMP